MAHKGECGLVLALGGGTLESARAAEMLRERRGVVFLDVSAEDAWARVEGSGRPLAVERNTFGALWARRRDMYEQASDWVVPVHQRGVDELAQDIVDMVGRRGQMGRTVGRKLSSTQRSSLIIGGKGALAVLEGRARFTASRARAYLSSRRECHALLGQTRAFNPRV
jgi:hypothetical protein